MKKPNQKETLIKISIILISVIITVIYFVFANRFSLASFISKIYAFPDLEYPEIANQTLKIFNFFVLEYICSCILLILNYVLYQKRHYKISFLINIIVIILSFLNVIPSYNLPYLLIFTSIVGIILSIISKYKKLG